VFVTVVVNVFRRDAVFNFGLVAVAANDPENDTLPVLATVNDDESVADVEDVLVCTHHEGVNDDEVDGVTLFSDDAVSETVRAALVLIVATQVTVIDEA